MPTSRQSMQRRARLEKCTPAFKRTCNVAKADGAIIQEAMADTILRILHLIKQGIILPLLLQDLLHIMRRVGGGIQSIPILMADMWALKLVECRVKSTIAPWLSLSGLREGIPLLRVRDRLPPGIRSPIARETQAIRGSQL